MLGRPASSARSGAVLFFTLTLQLLPTLLLPTLPAAAQDGRVARADALFTRSGEAFNAGDLDRAISLIREALKIHEESLGSANARVGSDLHYLAFFLEEKGEMSEAESLYRRAVAIRRQVHGRESLEYALSLFKLAEAKQAIGALDESEAGFREAVPLFAKVVGTDHPRYAICLNNFADLLYQRGEYSKAEPLLLRALEVNRRVLGEGDPATATSMFNLGLVYAILGAYEKAEDLLRRALEIDQGKGGTKTAAYALSLQTLANLYRDTGQIDRAEPLYREALAILGSDRGGGHPARAMVMVNLGSLYVAAGDYRRAEPLLREALALLEKIRGPHRAELATLTGLAGLYESLGEYAKAEPLALQALEAQRRTSGEEHPDFALALANLGRLYQSMGEYAKAEPLVLRALEIERRLLDANSAVQSERLQLQMAGLFRLTLDRFLSLSSHPDAEDSRAYTPVLAWKGAILTREARTRVLRGEPEFAPLFAELESVSRRLATVSLSGSTKDRDEYLRRQLLQLAAKKEELERELSLKSSAFRGVRGMERLAPDALQRLLPEGSVLVDYLEYRRTVIVEEEGRRSRREVDHLVAFVVFPEGPIRRIELGPSEPIAKTITEWREAARREESPEVGSELRKLLWAPIEPFLQGVTTVLVSPDGSLNRLPFAALPGRKPGTFLVEDLSVAVVPVPQLLPDLLSRAPTGAKEGSLLLVGDVDYDGPSGKAVDPVASRQAAGSAIGGLPEFRRLPATRAEIASIRDSFETRWEKGRLRILRRAEATEAAFRVEAPRHRWLHVATHGFFAPPELKSALAGLTGERFGAGLPPGRHPLLLSGLVLCGANSPPGPDQDDGILTALEVAALDLSRVEVVVLSACDTGLGEVAGGEGVLGLQRAFQAAGAGTTITSLWEVPDLATQLLMQRLYENLWDKGLPKIEALREAQLWLLREGGRRGLGGPRDEETEGGRRRLPVQYWAGFVLSGDWR